MKKYELLYRVQITKSPEMAPESIEFIIATKKKLMKDYELTEREWQSIMRSKEKLLYDADLWFGGTVEHRIVGKVKG